MPLYVQYVHTLYHSSRHLTLHLLHAVGTTQARSATQKCRGTHVSPLTTGSGHVSLSKSRAFAALLYSIQYSCSMSEKFVTQLAALTCVPINCTKLMWKTKWVSQMYTAVSHSPKRIPIQQSRDSHMTPCTEHREPIVNQICFNTRSDAVFYTRENELKWYSVIQLEKYLSSPSLILHSRMQSSKAWRSHATVNWNHTKPNLLFISHKKVAHFTVTSFR